MDYSKVDIKGQKFGKLTAIEKVDGTKSKWIFRCDCGNTIELNYGSIVSGRRTCGCSNHGYSRTKLYRRYRSMLGRCYDEHVRNYNRYGGRGIRVCDEWRNSFLAFREWALATGYDEMDNRQSLDRIDNNGNYCPENCRWATPAEQQKNRECTTLYPYKGEMYSASEFADKFGITDKSFVYRRLKTTNQSLEYILSDWNKIHNVPSHLVEVEQVAKEKGVHPATVRRWINEGKIEGEKVGRKWYIVKQ